MTTDPLKVRQEFKGGAPAHPGEIVGPCLAFGQAAEYLMEEMLTVYEVQGGKKVRVGNSGDGGYVILDGGNYDVLISVGIDEDDSFEHDFLSRHPNLQCHTFDGQIDVLPNPHPRITHHKQNVAFFNKGVDGWEGDETTATMLHEEMEEYSNIFMKMDIEGAEFMWLGSVSEEHLNSIKQLVLELHWAPWYWFEALDFEREGPERHSDMGLQCDKHINVLRKLMHTHYLVHMHPNNGCGTHTARTHNNESFTVPDVFEITCVRKRDCGEGEDVSLNTQPIPSDLDSPNNETKPDIQLASAPYTHAPTANLEEYFNSLYKLSYI